MTGSKSFAYLALLRGINVGGHNLISKQQLVHCFSELGLDDVSTYIQSGNILFRSKSKSAPRLTKKIEKGLSEAFDYAARAVVIPRSEYNQKLSMAHSGWGKHGDQKHNALFLLPEISPEQVLDELPKPVRGVEKVSIGNQVMFWSVSKDGLSKSTMMKLGKSKRYKQMTVRNHNTTFRLQSMLKDMG